MAANISLANSGAGNWSNQK